MLGVKLTFDNESTCAEEVDNINNHILYKFMTFLYLIPLPHCSWTHLLYQCIVLQDFARLHDAHNGSLQKQFSILVHGVNRVLHLQQLIDQLLD